MSPELTLPDRQALHDLETFLGRARRVDPDGACRLVVTGGVLAVYVSPVHGGGGPTVLGLRVLALAPAAQPGRESEPRTGTRTGTRIGGPRRHGRAVRPARPVRPGAAVVRPAGTAVAAPRRGHRRVGRRRTAPLGLGRPRPARCRPPPGDGGRRRAGDRRRRPLGRRSRRGGPAARPGLGQGAGRGPRGRACGRACRRGVRGRGAGLPRRRRTGRPVPAAPVGPGDDPPRPCARPSPGTGLMWDGPVDL